MTDKEKQIPEHLGIIMSGARRWARERNLPINEGYFKSYQKLKHVPDWFFARGVKVLSVFIFGASAWDRSGEEVSYLMKLIKRSLENKFELFDRCDYRIVISGRIEDLPGDLPEVCAQVQAETQNNAGGILNICLNYGGREEILDVIRKIVKKQVEPEQVHEGLVRKYLYSSDLPDLDMLVRTAGDKHLSDFMVWRAWNAELFFMEKWWPDFEKGDVDLILSEYARR